MEGPAGARVYALVRKLDAMGYALDQLGSYDGQSLFGALCTGTHGSGASQPPMADYAVSLDMACKIGGKVKVFRVEPTNGPTDRDAFKKAHPDWEIIADDSTFRAATVSMGSFGLVFAITVAVRPRYILDEVRELVAYEPAKLLQEVHATSAKGLDNRVQIEWAMNAYGGKLIRTRRELRPATAADRPPYPKRELPGLLRQMLLMGPTKAAQRTKLASTFVGRRNVIALSLSTGAKSMPDSVGYEVLKLGAGRYITAPSCEIALPFDKTQQGIEALQELAKNEGVKFALPYGLRFVRASKAWLAAEYDDQPNAVYSLFEISMMLHQRDYREVIHASEEALVKLGGRPHWGQWNHLNRAKIDAMWPKKAVDAWLAARTFFDPQGHFDNLFTRRCGL